VALTLGPFSSLLTAPAAAVAHRYGYAFVEGAGGAPVVFAQKLNNVFDVSLPVANELDPFTAWVNSLPAGQRPATAAYPMADDPFATPQVQRTQSLLEPMGVKTAYSKVFPEEVADYKAPADSVAQSQAQAVVLELHRRADRFRLHEPVRAAALQPEDLHQPAGPDQGSAAFTSTVGRRTPTA
jgi:branched-chain amino acid transport system substrate-binding protein